MNANALRKPVPGNLLYPQERFCLPAEHGFSTQDAFQVGNRCGVPIVRMEGDALELLDRVRSTNLFQTELQVYDSLYAGMDTETLVEAMGGEELGLVHPGHVFGYMRKRAAANLSRRDDYELRFFSRIGHERVVFVVSSQPNEGYAVGVWRSPPGFLWRELKRFVGHAKPS